MHRLTATLLAMLFATLVLASSSLAGPLPDESRLQEQTDISTVTKYANPSSSRNKRQSADVRTAEYLAWIALGGRVPPHGCMDVGCGVVDVYSSGKKKRDYGDEQRYQILRSLIERAADNNVLQN